jgi:hypothetical protein
LRPWIQPSSESSFERFGALLPFRIVRRHVHEHADPPHPLWLLLCAPRERPRRRRAAEQRDEVPPFQLIELHSIPASQGRM